MSAAPALPSLADSVVPVAAGAEVAALVWLGTDVAAFALADGGVMLAREGDESRIDAHPEGAILVAAADGKRLVTGGDDGRVVATSADGKTDVLAETGGGWIDSLALHPSGGFAYGSGRNVTAQDDKGRTKALSVPSAARGLAFAPKGFRLAIAHYNGATLWYPNLEAKPELLDWKGSHLDVAWSPDGRFVVTTMQENALHGWRLQPDRGHMRMSGYAAKPRSLAWSFGGAWLATSGADAAIAWPFDSKEGPTGKAPRECGLRHAKVTRVAFHPHVNVLAIGYEDGCILMIRFDDGAELLVRRASPGSTVTALAWDRKGARLGFGSQDGAAGILTLPGVARVLKGLFGKRQGQPEAGRHDAERVKAWVRAIFGLPEATGLTVSEIECLDPGCPGTETVILIMPEGSKVRAVKIGKPMFEIAEADVAEVFAMAEAAR